MSGADDIPTWAMERAKALRDEGFARGDSLITHTFARYIASKEEAPVDPLLLEAREICAKHWEGRKLPSFADKVRRGLCDDHSDVSSALVALRRRGLELAKEQGHG